MDHVRTSASSELLPMVDAGIDALAGPSGPHRAAADGRLHTALLAAVQLHARRGPAVVLVRAACASLRARQFDEAHAVLLVVHDALTADEVVPRAEHAAAPESVPVPQRLTR